MDKDHIEIDAWKLAEMLAEDPQIWSDLVGTEVAHAERGKGSITAIEQRGSYDPLITLMFSQEVKVWPPSSFKNGKTTLFINQGTLSRARSAYEERRAEREAADLKAKHQEEIQRKAAAERQARIDVELEKAAAARRERERFAALPLEEKHREMLKRLGLPYEGVRPATPRHRRVTHCYSCKERLDNSVDVECIVCGWILCTCGACGCGYSGLRAMA